MVYRLRVAATMLLCCSFLPSWAHGQGAAPPSSARPDPFWADLTEGAYTVGFRTIFQSDHSRTWAATRNYKGGFSADLNGRPVQINVWYPAVRIASPTTMRFADYINQSAPVPFKALNDEMRKRNRDDALSSISDSSDATLLATKMQAHRDAQPEVGLRPVVLYFGGLSSSINSNLVLAEYLASHGYIFVSISLVGPSQEEMFQSRTPEELDSAVRDMEFAWSLIQVEPNVDRTKVAAMGHSVGAVEAVMLGMRNGNISSVIGLDGTYGFSGSASVLTGSYGYDPKKMRAHLFDIRRSRGAQGNDPLDLSAIESLRYADRTFITVDAMHHSDFTSFAMIGSTFHSPLPTGYPLNGWDRETGRTGYDLVCRLVLLSLDATLKKEPGALAQLDRQTHSSNRVHERTEEGNNPPPSPLEAAQVATTSGLEAAKAALIASCGSGGLASCVSADQFNQWGYIELGQGKHQEALMLFLLNTWAHPQAANLFDSLADGYAAVSDKVHFRDALQQAIVLVDKDPSLNGAAKQTFMKEEREKLQKVN